MTALVTKHLPLVSGAPDGIKKLRELVLELAVCGRLLAQDASDEPVDLLIERIEALKALQISSGTVKRQKATTQPTVPPNHAIPESWRFVQLGDVVEIVRGITFPASEKSKEPSPGRIACLRTANVQSQIEWDDLLYIDESFVSREDQFLQPNDIVMSMANSRELVGKVALVGGELLQRSTFGGFLGVLRPYLIEPRFVMALLRTPSARSALIDSASQTTNIANISLGKLRPLMVALPPLSEQHRIVAKVDELMALCDRLEVDQTDAEAAHAQLVQALLDSLTQATDAADFRACWQRLSEHFHTLFTTEASIDALKQAVLQLAVMGRLVTQDATDKSATSLLEEIARTQATLIETEGLRTSAQINVPAAERYIEVPDGWFFYRLGNLAKFIDYRGRTPFKTSEGIPLITAKNVRRGFISREPAEFIATTEYTEWMTRGIPRVGDILFTTEAPLGNVAVIDIHERFALAQRVICFQLHLLSTGPYVRIALMSQIVQDQVAKMATGMTATGVKASKLKELPLPIPPLAEQYRIVAKVDELMALCDQLKAQLVEYRQQHAQLATALVEQAVA